MSYAYLLFFFFFVFFFKQKTAYEMRISDWSSDVCSSDLIDAGEFKHLVACELHIAFRHLHERYGQRLDQQVINGKFDATARKPGIKFAPQFQQFVELHVHRKIDMRHSLLGLRSEEHTSELQSLMRNSYAVFYLKKKKKQS